jgi:hypothetical protein
MGIEISTTHRGGSKAMDKAMNSTFFSRFFLGNYPLHPLQSLKPLLKGLFECNGCLEIIRYPSVASVALMRNGWICGCNVSNCSYPLHLKRMPTKGCNGRNGGNGCFPHIAELLFKTLSFKGRNLGFVSWVKPTHLGLASFSEPGGHHHG